MVIYIYIYTHTYIYIYYLFSQPGRRGHYSDRAAGRMTEEQWFDTRQDLQIFLYSKASKSTVGLFSPLLDGYRTTGHAASDLPLFSAGVNYVWNFTSNPPYNLRACTGINTHLPLPYMYLFNDALNSSKRSVQWQDNK